MQTTRTSYVTRALAVSALLAIGLLSPAAAAAQQDGSGVPTSIDPCQLVTSSEASSLSGALYTDGIDTTNEGGSRTCVYGSQTLNVFMITVAQAADADTAQAEWTQQQAQVQNLMASNIPAGANINFDVSDVNDLDGADRAAAAQGGATLSGQTISASAFYLLKGTTFVGFSDLQLGTSAPSSDAMESQAATVVGRLP